LTASPWTWVTALAVLGVAAFLVFSRRKLKPAPEVCAKCGYDMTGRSGACPQCGETRRLPKPDYKKVT
jgi:predicted amidophosphoribosyltransferase